MSEGSGRVEIVIKGARFTEADAEAQVHGICFKTGPPQRVGVELEWLARDPLPLESSQPGVFVAGDVRHGSIKRVAAAVGEGAMAIALLHTYLAQHVDGR